MYRITTQSGRVGHIAGSIVSGNDERFVTTVCGNTHPESEFHVDDSLDPCSGCDKKFEAAYGDEEVFDSVVEEVVEEKPVAKETAKPVTVSEPEPEKDK